MTDLFETAPVGFKKPRPFQAEAMKLIAQGLIDGHKNQMIMAPTGAGKTYLGLRLAHKALKAGKRVVFVCDRVTLIDQTSARADEYGLTDHGVIQADHNRQDWSCPLQIASIQTIESRGWPEVDVAIVDEAHTQRESWVKFAMESEARVFGLSATPFSRGLGKIFTNLISNTTMHQLTQERVLVPMRVLSARRPDMTGAKVGSDGEWTHVAAGERGMEIIGDVVAEWMRHGEGRKTIIFGATIAHCEEICRKFSEVGIYAATFTKDTPPEVRRELVREFSKPASMIRILISVEALAKGFDVPDVGCVVDCRPLRKSLSLAIQMWGRGLRASEETGKTDCILLDHSGNITRFAEDFTEIFFNGLQTLDMGETLDRAVRNDDAPEPERKGCPKCGYKPFRQRCMSCGFEIIEKSGISHEAGVMEEFTIGKHKLRSSEGDLWLQLCSFARDTSWVQKKSGYAYMKFKELTGREPPRFPRYDDAPPVEVPAALADGLDGKRKSRHIADAYRRKKMAVAA